MAWDPSCNNIDSLKGPTVTAKTTAWALLGPYVLETSNRLQGTCSVFTDMSGSLPELFRHELFL